MMNVSYMEDFDGIKCDHPECNHTGRTHTIVVTAKCHPGAGCQVEYHEGLLIVRCKLCKDTLLQVAVARKPDPGEAIFSDKG